ncbi:MAG: hypothetical protein A3K54_01245 [Omnitrophica WOR_2 bacterium RBG_13_44_8]|nr:MAG: hypothetical protein A3K54_01245 [Omnitrophica WOR_2 bacterium RBG_13_44_8]
MKVSYFPGCSLETSATDYDISAKKTCEEIDIELHELEDWSCCGALCARNINYNFSLALPSRNLCIAEDMGYKELIAPCAACYSNLQRINDIYNRDTERKMTIEHVLGHVGLNYKGDVKINSLLQFMCRPEITDLIKKRVKNKLTGLKVAAYYGCLLTRPKNDFDDTQDPRSFEKLMKVLGAEPIYFSMKTKCCGGVYSTIKTEIAYELGYQIMMSAREADIITVACPLCQMSLDAFQTGLNKFYKTDFEIPIIFFTHLLGLAFGVDEMRYGLNNQFISPVKTLERWLS